VRLGEGCFVAKKVDLFIYLSEKHIDIDIVYFFDAIFLNLKMI